MDTLLKRFAKRLSHLREESGLSQEALASASKLHPTYISALERALKVPRLTTVEQLARALDIELRELMDFADDADRKADSKHGERLLILKALEKADLTTLKKARKIIQALME